MLRTRVKFCGITRQEDAKHAAFVGADAIGLVFYSGSPRFVTIEQGKKIVEALPPYVTKVGVFVNEDLKVINSIYEQVGLDIIQFHGEESPQECEALNKPYYKVASLKPSIDLHQFARTYKSAQALHLDTYSAHQPGGTGKTFNWELVPDHLPLPVILSGGISQYNVADAIRKIRPYAIDLTTSIEAAKGLKDHEKMALFMREVMNSERL